MVRAFVLMLLFWVGTLAAQEPIGIRVHNPGNVAPNNWHTWSGAIGKDAFGHAIFKDDLHGFRAIKRVLKCYEKKHHFKTAYQIAKRWINLKATEKQRMDYALTLAQFTGKGPRETIDLKNPRVLLQLAHGIIQVENGKNPYPEKLYERVFINEP